MDRPLPGPCGLWPQHKLEAGLCTMEACSVSCKEVDWVGLQFDRP